MKGITELDHVVIKFAGDSGDGMQLTGTLFSEAAAHAGNDLSTFPDYPAEIRAPQNTVSGVSGYQVHIGSTKINTSGDFCDVLVAMNPASLKANLKWAKMGATIITNADAFDEKTCAKAGYEENPLYNDTLSSYQVIKAPINVLTKEALAPLNVDFKTVNKSRNMFALGLLLYLFDKDLSSPLAYLKKKFAAKPELVDINKRVLEAGYIYGENIEALESRFHVSAAPLEKGLYRNITGNIATAWGLMAASENSGRPIFLGSYPITPATDILVELTKHRSLGVKTLQAEDEIAGICSAIGAAYAGSLAVTSTSGPGLSLKSEAIGLAVITELPLVLIDVQRAGPSTGMPTKSEQADLYQALFGRNGECPCIVMAASSPVDCFYSAYEAAKLAMEHMTPVILLSDAYIGNGSQLFRIPKVKDLAPIVPPLAQPNDPDFKPFRRDPETFVRKWALPGTPGLRHRVGGLEKTDIFGAVSTDGDNHEKMVAYRHAKVQKVADFIAPQKVEGDEEGDLLLISWGGTYGAVVSAMQELKKEGLKIGHAHFRHIMPLPRNTSEIFGRYKRLLVCELNSGQFVNYLRMTFPQYTYLQYNRIYGKPFFVSELTGHVHKILSE